MVLILYSTMLSRVWLSSPADAEREKTVEVVNILYFVIWGTVTAGVNYSYFNLHLNFYVTD